MQYVGIDVASLKHDCTIITDQGEILKDGLTITNDSNGFEDLMDTMGGLGATPETTKIGMEETGIYHERIRTHLMRCGYNVYTINPALIFNSRKAKMLRSTKTDKVDALVIARYLMMHKGSLHSYTPSLYHLDALKSSTRIYHAKRETLARTKTELKRLLHSVFPEFKSHYDPLSQWALDLLESYPTPEDIAKMHEKTLIRILRTNGNRMETAKHIRMLAKQSVGQSDSMSRQLIRFAICDLKHFKAQIREIKAVLEEQMKPFSHIMSIPGVGALTGATILAEIGDIERFSHKTKLLAYTGIDPVIYESGKFKAKNTTLSKRGSRYLRSALFMAARAACVNTSIIKDNKFRRKYEAKIREGKHHYTAVFAAAKNLTYTIYGILKSGQPFEYDY